MAGGLNSRHSKHNKSADDPHNDDVRFRLFSGSASYEDQYVLRIVLARASTPGTNALRVVLTSCIDIDLLLLYQVPPRKCTTGCFLCSEMFGPSRYSGGPMVRDVNLASRL